mgnify:CR=1 FL=1|tara:strand:- start:10 stop:603 length:594 start_codon:yes stop_codon:yes gene_type:complete
MKLDVVRTQFGADATNGMLFIDGVFECFTLEDEVRDVKVHSETAIPLGEYEIKLRTEGGFHSKYTARYGSMHKGMLWLQDVPNFQWILIHTGNTDSHTAGCLLLGETQQDLDKGKDGFVGGSGDAYKKMYPKVRDALLAGEKVTIKYSNINLDDKPMPSNKATEDVVLTKVIDDKFDKILKELKNLRSAVFTVKNIT